VNYNTHLKILFARLKGDRFSNAGITLNESLRHKTDQYCLGYFVYVVWRNDGNSCSQNFTNCSEMDTSY